MSFVYLSHSLPTRSLVAHSALYSYLELATEHDIAKVQWCFGKVLVFISNFLLCTFMLVSILIHLFSIIDSGNSEYQHLDTADMDELDTGLQYWFIPTT